MSIIVVFWLSKIEISWKIAKKVDFRIFLAPIWGFSTKKGFTFRESPNFVIPFGTKNHEMRGPPVSVYVEKDKQIFLSLWELNGEIPFI